MRTLYRLLCGLGAVVCLALQPAQATLPGGGGGDTTSTTTTYYEQGILIRSGEVVEPLGPNLMGDSVNGYTGGLEFTHSDVSLPGNFALPVAVGRHRAVGTTQTFGGGLFGAHAGKDLFQRRAVPCFAVVNVLQFIDDCLNF